VSLAPVIAPYDPTSIDVYNVLSPPSKAHLLGTDELGRDLLSRIIWGSRVSLKVGFVAVGIAITIGILVGSIAGFYGGRVDAILMRFVDMMLAFPTFFRSYSHRIATFGAWYFLSWHYIFLFLVI